MSSLRRQLFVFVLAVSPAAAGRAQQPSPGFQKQVAPVLQARCAECHGGEKPAARLDLARPQTIEPLHWFRILERIEDGSMPPKDEPPLAPAERQAIAGWVRGEHYETLVAERQKLGRSRLRRLNRGEYANTVYDLFGIRPPAVKELPFDGRVDGFDKVGAALPLSSAHAAGYLKMAEDLLRRFPIGPLEAKKHDPILLGSVPSEQSKGHILELPDGWHVSFNTDTTSGPLRKRTGPNLEKLSGFPGVGVPGLYRLRMHVYGYQTDKPLPFGIYVGHVFAYPQILELRKVLEAPPGKPAVLEAEVYLRTGRDSDGPSDDGIRLIPFGLGVQVPKNTQASNCKGPGLAIQWVEVLPSDSPAPGDQLLFGDLASELRGPFSSERDGNSLAKSTKLPRADIEAAARSTLARVGARLYRRDLTEAELSAAVAGFNARFDAGARLREALRGELVAMMTSPDFLCLVENPGPLDDFALASRLSYFLWNSAPDEQLLAVARSKKLTDSAVLRAETERLLADPRSDRFVKDFADQWLGLWGVDNTTPDRDLYPEYDDLLKISSVMETQATLRRMLDENRSVREFVAPKTALVNERLAQHYGLSDVSGFALRDVALPADSPFGGLWTQAATMKVTANGTLTSPVKRGVWMAERLLGVTIPPPPPNIDPVDPDTRGAKTLREQLALHSSQGSCKACHAKFDPYGFALESFDVMGAHRSHYRIVDPTKAKAARKWSDGLPVDSSGVTPDGVTFQGIGQLRPLLAAQPDRLARGVVRHLLTYATGAPSGPLDQRTIDQIADQAKTQQYGLRTLVHGVVQSEQFRSK